MEHAQLQGPGARGAPPPPNTHVHAQTLTLNIHARTHARVSCPASMYLHTFPCRHVSSKLPSHTRACAHTQTHTMWPQVSPHEFMQAVILASKKRFTLDAQVRRWLGR